MDVVREVLDTLVVDRDGREMGRVDGIVLEPRDGRPPRLAAILIGPAALGDRLHPRIGRWIRAVERQLALPRDRPVQIAFEKIEVGTKIRARLRVAETAVGAVERRLRKWVGAIPGGR